MSRLKETKKCTNFTIEMEITKLIEGISKAAAEETVQALAIAQQMGMVNSQAELTALISAGMETAIEEYIMQVENQQTGIIDEA